MMASKSRCNTEQTLRHKMEITVRGYLRRHEIRRICPDKIPEFVYFLCFLFYDDSSVELETSLLKKFSNLSHATHLTKNKSEPLSYTHKLRSFAIQTTRKKPKSKPEPEPRPRALSSKNNGTKTNGVFSGISTYFANKKQRTTYNLKNKKGKSEKMSLFNYFVPTQVLGEGSYAIVCGVMDTRTMKSYAVKKNRNVFANLDDARRILRELKLMIHMKHPNVMSLYDCIPPVANENKSFRDVYLVMRKYDTTLRKIIRSKQKLSEKHIQYFVYQIARGLEYMHSGGIIHRDLKPENVLVNAADCRVKITDFGLARGVRIDIDSSEKLTEYVVTRWYRAPEVMCCSRLYDSQIDTWGLGCITAELFTRKPVFKGRNHIEQLQLIFDIMGTPKNLDWITSPGAKKWIAGMQKKLPQDLKKTLPNSSVNAQDFVKQLLTLNPHHRLDITQAINHIWMKVFARDKDYKKCPTFNISFEYEARMKTEFGVRHMMFEELNNFHKACVFARKQ